MFKSFTNIIYSNKLFKETAWSALSKLVAFISFALLQVALARQLGRDLFGTWSFYLSLISVLALMSQFGINASSKIFIAKFAKTRLLSKVLTHTLVIRLVVSLLFCIFLSLIFEPFLARFIKPVFQSLLLPSILFIYFSNITEYFKSIFMGLHRLKYTFFVSTTEHILKLMFVIISLFLSTSVISVVFGYVVAYIFASLIGLFILINNYSLNISLKQFESTIIKNIMRYSAPLFLANIGILLSIELNTIMLGIFSSNVEVAKYSLVGQLVQKFQHISIIITAGSMPIFANINKNNITHLKNTFNSLLGIITKLYIFFAISLLSIAHLVIPFVYGPEYKGSVTTLYLLLPYFIAFSFATFLNSFLDYQVLVWKRATLLFIFVIINIALNVLLIPKYGANGAAISSSASYLPYTFLVYLESKKQFSIHNFKE